MLGGNTRVAAPIIVLEDRTMKTQLTLLGMLACMTGGTAAGGPPADWNTFSSKSGGFTVLMPGAPKEYKVGDSIRFRVIMGNTSYGIIYDDHPDLKDVNVADAKKSLESGVEATVKSTKGKLLSSKDVKLGEHFGLEFQIELAKGGIMRARVYLVKGRAYQLVVMAPPDVATSKVATDFLDSFKLTK